MSTPKLFRAPWGQIYGGSSQYRTPRGGIRWMCRRGQRVRFYTNDGEQVGPEQNNVAPAIVWAQKQGWHDAVVAVPPQTSSRRQVTTDREILVVNRDSDRRGYLPAHSLIRKVRAGHRGNYVESGYRFLFEASTDGGVTWAECATNDDLPSHES